MDQVKLFDNKFTDSLNTYLQRRVSSPFYATFVISWLVINWQFVYTLIFVSEEKIWQAYSVLKNEYLNEVFFQTGTLGFWVSDLILPISITILIIWFFPKWFLIRAFKKEEDNDFEMKEIRIDKDRKIKEAENKLVKEEVKQLETVEKKTRKEKAIEKISPHIEWDKEVDLIKRNYSDVTAIKEVATAIYRTYGNFTTDANNPDIYTTVVSPNSLSRADSLSLTNIDWNSSKISFTDKGKYIFRKLQEAGLVK